jgi:hypothetical protein
MGEWLPPFASGKLVGSYEPLKRYLEEARRRGSEEALEKALINENDLKLLRGLTLTLVISVDHLLSALEERFYERVDAEIAVEAYKALGVSIDRESARRMIARIIAGWLIEAGEYWKLYRLRGSWERDDEDT